MSNRHTAWFVQGATGAIIVDSTNGFIDVIPLSQPFEVDEWNPHIAHKFCCDVITAHYGLGRWVGFGDNVVDAHSKSFGFTFDRQA